MLVLTRKVNERIKVGVDVTITVVRVTTGGRVRLGIDAPADVVISRTELLERRRSPSPPEAAA